jgi:CRISPR-associated protein Cas7/Csd2, subtype I-C/DVULG
MSAINNRYEFILLFDVENGNPNGDPDAGNLPRVDAETGRGLVTDVCLKRKVRNFVDLTKAGEKGFNIYVREKAVLSEVRAPAYEETGAKKGAKGADIVKQAQDWMLKNFYDVRTFGAVMSTKENNCGQVRGPVQFTFSSSIDPIMPQEVSITRMAVETSKEAKDQDGDNRTMGRKHIVPYGLYRLEGFVSAHLAQKTGFTEGDLSLLWEALMNMFEHDRSAARGKMCARKLFVFKHDNAIGKAPAQTLFKRVTVKKNDPVAPARAFEDYTVAFDKTPVPGVELLEKL